MKTSKKRPSWDRYFLNLSEVVRERSNCLRMSTGAVLIKDKRIIATGYNGTPSGTKNCFEGGCERCLKRHKENLKEYEGKELCVCIHAEQNALLQSALHGMSTNTSVLYTTTSPCLQCAKALINTGVKEVIYIDDHYSKEHPDNLGIKLLKSAGVKVRRYK